MTEEHTSPSTELPATDPVNKRKERITIISIVVVVLLAVAGIGLAIYALLQNSTVTAQVRDIFIIFMALQSLVIGTALIILILQIASLINLLKNEIKPIVDATSETVHTLRGTTQFLSENLVDPVIKLNSSMAGLRKMMELFGIRRR